MRMHPQILTEAQLKQLRELAGQVSFRDTDRQFDHSPECGRNHYRYSKWLGWGLEKRKLFKSLFPKDVMSFASVGWFLDLPATTGVLGRMTHWVNKRNSGYFVSYNIGEDALTIHIDDRPVVVKSGEGICFSARHIHELKPADFRRLWACVMLPGAPLSWPEELALFRNKE